jgi:hypothetical protein
MLRTRRLAILVAACLGGVFVPTAALASGGVSPTLQVRAGGSHPQRSAAPAGGVSAVVVRSWGACTSGSLAWDSLNANWSQYGSIPISIDYANPSLCGSTITLSALEASGAHVVIMSDPAGGLQQYSSDEIAALQQYALEGHNLIGTFLTFRHSLGGIDNSGLAPLFGLSASGGYDLSAYSVAPVFKVHNPPSQLFRNIGHPYMSLGYAFAQVPSDGGWSSNELAGATMVGGKYGRKDAVFVYEAGAYDAVYITNMPEYNTAGSTADEQFLYNAIIYPATG